MNRIVLFDSIGDFIETSRTTINVNSSINLIFRIGMPRFKTTFAHQPTVFTIADAINVNRGDENCVCHQIMSSRSAQFLADRMTSFSVDILLDS